MNIAFTYPSPFNPQLGGVERVTDVLCREFQRRGHKVFYFHHRDEDKYQGFTPPAPTYFSTSADFTSPEALNSYHNFLRENSIEVVINQCGLFSDSTLYTNVHAENIATPKVISVMHGDPLRNYKHLFKQISSLKDSSWIEFFKCFVRCLLYPCKKIKHIQERRKNTSPALSNSDAIVLLSEGYRKSIRVLHGNVFPPCPIYSIPNPLSPHYMVDQYSARKPWLIFVGRLDFISKRPDRLLQIWARIHHFFREWELHIIGDGPYRAQLEDRASKLPRVIFEGRRDPSKFYQQGKIILMTSNFEGFPMVLTEAMEQGCVPILFESFAAARDIIDDGHSGILVTPFNVNEYTHKLVSIMRTEQRWVDMSTAAKKKAKDFEVKYIVNQWEELLYHPSITPCLNHI